MVDAKLACIFEAVKGQREVSKGSGNFDGIQRVFSHEVFVVRSYLEAERSTVSALSKNA
jgi:hypothetical protein